MYDKEVKQYAKQVKRNVEYNILMNYHRRAKLWDYPACVSLCFRKKGPFVKGYSHSPEGTIWHDALKLKMCSIGIIGEKTKYCSNILGKCAEQHSGNNYMNRFNVCKLAQLRFSPTIRPRTCQVIKSCNNCKKLFPSL